MNESRPVESNCSCRDLESMLAAYVDGEAASCDCDKVQAHIEGCPCCRDRLAGERAAREAIRARRSGLRACAPEELKARCAAFAAQRDPRVPSVGAVRERPRYVASKVGAVRNGLHGAVRERPLRWVPFSLAATLVLAVATVFGFGLTDKAHALAFQTTIDHAKCTRFNLGETAVDSNDAARQWQSRFGWAISVPASSRTTNLELRGVRRCGVLDGSVAHVMYMWRGEPLSVYVLPKRTVGDAAQLVHRFQYNSIMWSQNDRTYIMVTPHQRDASLDAMVAYVRAAAH